MAKAPQNVVLIAGPNGAGKSTAVPKLLRDTLEVDEFVNADTIARGLSGFHPELAAFAAGRLMLQRMRELVRQRSRFAFESTLATRSFAPWLSDLKKLNYDFHLVFLWLPTPEMAVSRVAERVRAGGHDVPEETIRRRYQSGLSNLIELYIPLAKTWRIYDNSELNAASLIAFGSERKGQFVVKPHIWQRIEARRLR